MNSRLDDLKQNVSRNPSDPRSHFELACAAQALGQLELAVECFTKVTQLAPSVAVGHFNLGNACFSLKRFDEATMAFEKAVELSPDRGTLNNLGNTCAAMGKFRQAIQHYQRALQLPDDGTGSLIVLKNLGMALEAHGDRASAANTYRQAVELPECPALILCQLGKLLAKTDPQQALDLLESHCAKVQESPELLALRADCLAAQHSLEQALADLMHACDLAPDHPRVLSSLGEHYNLRGRHFEALVCLHRALTYEPHNLAVHSAWLHSQLHQDQVDWPRFRQEAERWATHYHESVNSSTSVDASVVAKTNSREASPLRLGLVAGTTAAGKLHFLQPLLIHAGTHPYEVSCYIDSSVAAIDAGLRHLPNVRWISTRDMGDDQLRNMIQADGIDVLIDLQGHAPGNRLQVFALRAAPLQVAWAGWPATTGLPSMDFIITDKATVLDDEFERFTERILRLPDSLMAWSPIGLETITFENETGQRLVLGAVCSAAQLSDKTVSVWCKILRQIPEAHLRLADLNYADASVKKDVLERFRARDIDSLRIELVASDDVTGFVKELQVMLDPFPINASDAFGRSLLVGTPGIAWRGDRMSARTTASLLEAAALQQWIADTPDQYCQLVSQLVSKPPSRRDLQRHVATSKLCDTDGWSRAFIAALATHIHRG